MNDLYKAISSLKDIIVEEESTVNEKIDLKTGYYTGTNITPSKLQLDRLKKRGIVPQDYRLPKRVSKTNPSARPFIDFINKLGKKASEKGEKIFPKRIGDKEVDVPTDVSQGSTVSKKPKVDYEKIKKGIRAQSDAMKKGKVKATAANTKNYDSTLALQKSLIAKGAKIDADGIMGPKTRAAMKKFGQPGATPIARPKMTPKSGGPDKRFITGPELDMPNKRGNFLAAPPERMDRVSKNNQKNSPGNPFSPDKRIKPKIDPRMPDLNRYAQKQDGTYKPISPNVQPKSGDSFVDRIGKGFDKMGKDLKGFGKDIYNFADKYGIASNLNRYAQKNANKNKMANKESDLPQKTMIEQITGKKTCL